MLLYKLQKNTNSEQPKAYGKYFAFSVPTKTIGDKELAHELSAHNTGFSEGQVRGLLADMVKIIKSKVIEGIAVKIEDLAIFSLGIVNKEGAETKKAFSVLKNVESVKLRARATGEVTRSKLNLEASLKNIEKLTKSKINTNGDDGGDDDGEHITTPTNPSGDNKENPSQGDDKGNSKGDSSSTTDPDDGDIHL